MAALQLSSEHAFHHELVRLLSAGRYRGADVMDVLQAAAMIKPGDFESWHDAMVYIAERAEKAAPDPTKQPVAACDRLLAAATYYRAADFYLHGNADDARIMSLWEKQTKCFDTALKVLGYPAERHTLKAGGFEIPIIFYRASEHGGSRPTLIMGNGYDGAQEELLHVSGLAALERGYNVITYEGPGQPSVRRYQNKGFIHDWEKVVTPVVDFAHQQSSVDRSRIALFGLSMGGYLCLRAAAFEHRIAAVLPIDGVWSFGEAVEQFTSPPLKELFAKEDYETFDKNYLGMLASERAPTTLKWGMHQGLWSFCETSPAKLMQRASMFTLDNVGDKIQCPIYDACAEDDIFFKGQPEKVRDRLRDKVTFKRYTTEDGGHEHCQVGASVELNQDIFTWLDEKMPAK